VSRSDESIEPQHVITGLVPVIHVLNPLKDVDGRDKPGHDGWVTYFAASFAAIWATCRPWKRAPSRSISVG
jgi:hypothetical protein